MAFKVNLSEADKKKVAGLNEKQRQKYLSGNKVNNSSSLNNGTPLPTRDVLSGIGNAQVRNNAILGLDLFNRGNAFGAGSKATEQKYREIAASPEIQELARGQSYLKKELPQSGLMLGGDPVARSAAIRTGIKANATEQEREVQAAKDLIAAANSPAERFMQGLGRGLALGPTTRFSWQEETPTEKMVSDLTNNTVSGAAGNMLGEALPYLMAYGKLGGAVGDAAMKLPGAAKLGTVGQGVVKSVVADAVLSAPLNANYVVNKQGLGGKEAVKEFAKQEALDLGLGIGMEFIGAAFKRLRGKKLASGKIIADEADLLNLTRAEQVEVAEMYNMSEIYDWNIGSGQYKSVAEPPKTKIEKLADESNVRKGKNKIDNGVIEGWTAETLANERGLLPPKDEGIKRPYTIDSARANRELPRTVMPGEVKTSFADVTKKNILPPDPGVKNIKNDKLTEQINSMFRGRLPQTEPIRFGSTPHNLEQYGAKPLEVTMSQSVLRKIVYPEGYMGGKHNLGFAALDQVEAQLKKPLAVLKSATQNDSLVIVTRLLDERGNTVVLPLHLNKNGALGISNEIPSMYGKRDFDVFMSGQRKKGNVLFEDKKIGFGEATSDRLQLPELFANSDPMNEAVSASYNSILPLPQKNVKKDLGADTNRIGAYDEYNKRYGTFEGTDIPKATAYGDTSKHAATLEKGGQYGSETIEEVKNIIEEGGFSKFTKSNKTALDNAAIKLNAGVESAEKDFYSKLGESKKITSEDIALGYQLAKYFDEAGEYSRAASVLEGVTEMLSETGRTLQAGRLALKNSPLGRQRTVIKTAQKLSEKTGVDIKLADDILENISKARTPNDIARAMEEARVHIVEQVPPTFEDKFNAWRYTSMLGNVKTVVRNETGNAFSNFLRQTKDFIGTPLEAALQKGGLVKQGERTKAILNPIRDKAYIQSGRNEAKYFMADIQGNAKYGDIFTSRPPEAAIFGTKNNPVSKTVGKAMEGYRKITNKALEDGIGHVKLGEREFAIIKGDAGWLEKVYSDSWAKVVKANGWSVDEVLSDSSLRYKVHELAKSEAQRATFRDLNALSDSLSRLSLNLRTSDSKVRKVVGYLLEGIVPFKRTTMNVLRRSVEYSPLGLADGIGKFIKAAKNGESLVSAIDRLCAGLTGTGVAGIGAYLAYNDILNVNISNDKMGSFEKMQGEQPFSVNVKIGDKEYSYTLDWLAPAAVPLFAGAALMDGVKDDGFSWEDVFNVIDGMANPYFEMSMLQGVMNIFDTQSYGEGSAFEQALKVGGNAVFSLMGQTIPTVMGQFARTIDPSNRRTNVSDAESSAQKYLEYNINKNVISKLPIINQRREEYVDQWGRTSRKTNQKEYITNAIENFLSPGYVSEKKSGAIENEISSLYEKTGDMTVIPSADTEKSVVSGDDRFLLTGAEQTQYKKTRGSESYSRLKKLFKDDAYKSADNEHKVKMIKAEYTEANFQAKAEALVAHGKSPEDVYLTSDGMKEAYDRFGGKVSAKKTREIYKSFEGEYRSAWGK